MLCSVYSVFIVPTTGTLRLPRRRFYRAFPSVVRQMPRYNSQRWVTARTLPCLLIVLFYVLFVCKCVLCYCHRVSTQLQLKSISYFKSYIELKMGFIKIILNEVVNHPFFTIKLRSVSKQYNDNIERTIKFSLKMAQSASKHVGEC